MDDVVCPPGAFCPTSTDIFRCPAGYFCPFGSSEPLACEPYALCPEGSSVPRSEATALAVVAFLGVMVAGVAGFAGCRDERHLRVSKAVAVVVRRLRPIYLPKIARIRLKRLRAEAESEALAARSRASSEWTETEASTGRYQDAGEEGPLRGVDGGGQPSAMGNASPGYASATGKGPGTGPGL